MKDGMQVDPSMPSGYAAKIAEISTNAGDSTSTLTSMSLTGQAFDDLCSFLVLSSELTKKGADAVIMASATATDVTVSDLRTMTNSYETADLESTRGSRKLGETLGGTNV